MNVTNEKVTIPREVAEAIEHFRLDSGFSNDALLRFIGSEFAGFSTKHSKVLADYSNAYPETYVKAILNGYTIEQSPEERLREYYGSLGNGALFDIIDGKSSNKLAMQKAVTETLNILGITIEGINNESND